MEKFIIPGPREEINTDHLTSGETPEDIEYARLENELLSLKNEEKKEGKTSEELEEIKKKEDDLREKIGLIIFERKKKNNTK